MMQRHAITGARIIVEDRLRTGLAVVVDDDRILDIVREGSLPWDLPTQDLGGRLLAPGMVDIHVHGAEGHAFLDGTPEAGAAVAHALLVSGVTTALPTLSSCSADRLVEVAAMVGRLRGAGRVPRMPGLHLEGPCLAHAQRGAQPLSALMSPDDPAVEGILTHSAALRMVSLAPELPGALPLIERLVSAGIVVGAAHSDGTIDDLTRAQQVGLSHVVHIYSGQSTTRREGPWRVPGMLEATLASTDLTVEMIADGKHLPPALMMIAHRALAGNLCLVSDATSGAGLPDGTHYGVGDRERMVVDGVGMTLDRTSFSGSTTLLPDMLPIAHRTLGLSIPDSIAMVTSIPARAARLTESGRIAPGLLADFVVLTEDLTVEEVALGGQWITAGD